MDTLGTVVRVINILLCMAYIPLLAMRYNKQSGTYRRYLFGIFLVIASIIGGSSQRILEGDAFKPWSAVLTAGLACLMWASWKNEKQAFKARHRLAPPSPVEDAATKSYVDGQND